MAHSFAMKTHHHESPSDIKKEPDGIVARCEGEMNGSLRLARIRTNFLFGDQRGEVGDHM